MKIVEEKVSYCVECEKGWERGGGGMQVDVLNTSMRRKRKNCEEKRWGMCYACAKGSAKTNQEEVKVCRPTTTLLHFLSL